MQLILFVRHRIDGLEIITAHINTKTSVRHRIDGLEIFFVVIVISL